MKRPVFNLTKRTAIVFGAILFLVLLNISLGVFYLKFLTVAEATETIPAYPELAAVPMQAMSSEELKSYLKKIAETKGGVYAFEILKRADLPEKVDVHLTAHTIGDILFKQKGAKGIQYCTHDFRNACSHSIVIGLFLKEGEKGLSDLAPLCKKAPGGKGAYGMCFHGLGHGVLALSDYDMENAVRICDGLSPGKDKLEARECIGGTMMEMVSGVHDREVWQLQVEKYFTDDPLSPCSRDFVPSYAKPICYTYLTPSLVIAAGGTIANPDNAIYRRAFQSCEGIPGDQTVNRIACYGGFGKEFVVIAREKDVRNVAAITLPEIQKIYEWCSLAGVTDGERYCLDQSLNSLFWGGENDRAGAVRFCDAAGDDEGKSACFNRLTGLIGYYIGDKEYRKSYCSEIPSVLKSDCTKRLL